MPGIGPRLAQPLAKLAGPNVVDLLWHLPHGVIDRRHLTTAAAAPAGKVATLVVTIDAHFPSNSRRRPYRVRCRDETGFLHLVFFHPRPDWLLRALPVGERRVISGTVEHFNNEVQITHPDRIAAPHEIESVLTVEPVYSLTAGLSARVVERTIAAAIERAPQLAEWVDPTVISRAGWPTWHEALVRVHKPTAEPDLNPMASARQRLAYDELLANQLALGLVRANLRRMAGRSIIGTETLRRKVLDVLPYSLTGAQRRVLAEIDADMASPQRMLRLLQGDVGSGKTVVALLAMLAAVEAGTQTALMAPTEILARQHMSNLEPLAAAAGVRVALLTGRDKGRTRQAVLDQLAGGEIDILVGTHALFQDQVGFRDLGLAVVDEQHRFGVHQRLELAAKGRAVDMLVMTATPIPRTLALTAYGDMEISRLDEKPPGRGSIATRVLPLSRLDEVVSSLQRAIGTGARAYWVCPLVEESEASDLAAATERHAHLSMLFPGRVALVHGRMKAADKDASMDAFARGNADILVATTVIEVGVDVPEASVMVVEQAERFGLAQLHQLRGRIGRGGRLSTCLLLYGTPLTGTARARLNILRETDDGFRIAEEDLRLRGTGELLGTRQSGLPRFRLADLASHADLLAMARDDSKLILANDPDLRSPRGQALRTLLYLFERDSGVRTLRSG